MNIELLLLSYAGILLHYLLKLRDAAKQKVLTELFSRQSLVYEGISTLVSVVSATIIVYVKDDIATIFVVTPVGAVVAGYAGQSILNKILGAKMPQQVQIETAEVKIADAPVDPLIGNRDKDDR
jgi:hypothetical protein